MKKPQIYISLGGLKWGSIDDTLNLMKSINITNIEFGSGISYIPNVKKRLKKWAKNFNILLHGYFPSPRIPFVMNLASPDKEIRRKSYLLVKKALQLSSEIGAKVFGIHAGYRFDPEQKQLGNAFNGKPIPYMDAFDIFVDNICSLIDEAEPFGVKLAIENNVATNFNTKNGKNIYMLLCEPWEIEPFIKAVGRPDLGFLLDIGHLNVTAKTLNFEQQEYISRIYDRIYQIHLSYNDGYSDQNLPFPQEDIKPWYIRDIRYYILNGTPLTLEIKNINPDRLKEQIRYIEKWT